VDHIPGPAAGQTIKISCRSRTTQPMTKRHPNPQQHLCVKNPIIARSFSLYPDRNRITVPRSSCHKSISTINVAEAYGTYFLTEAFQNRLHLVWSPIGI
jgi:hypothetical protein